MDKNQAQKQIRDIFQHPFQRVNYQHFLRNLLNQIESRDAHYTGNLIPDSFKEHVTQYWRVGKYIDPDGIELDLLVVEVKSLSKLDRARSALRNFAVNRLKQFDKDCSLVAFYAKDDGGDDWRFSFVKIEHEAHQDEKGKVRLKTELTPAKRYSYLVGVHENSHTACQQLMPLLVMDYANPRIEEIEKAFSIEKVTDEFFEQYKGLYLKLSEQLQNQPFFQKKTEEENTQTVARFAKKLLGQIVFLYFLQKKGWLGVEQGLPWGKGPRRFMRERFTQTTSDGGNYYHDFLQYLFYEALAKERKGQADRDYYERFSCKIPFLNGGLFEAEYDDWHNLDIDLPNDLFHNDEKIKAGDIDSGTGILDVFDRYNFTIKEDEPLEKEVAVDPEMLGKVFENMLEVTERKSKGAFYTPREIVHYMCQESLIHYLDNNLNSYAKLYQAIDNDQPILFGGLTDKKGQQKLEIMHQDGIQVPIEDLETLIRKGLLFVENDEAALHALQRIESGEQKSTKHRTELPESIKSNAEKIDNYLASIRACDPAIGSGAFPVGLLHEIVNARLALAPHSGKNLSVYELKRHTIHESLYGVDIDPSAVDIARLRLWLSLIVDEDDFSADKALPNLDYKIVCGNSLIGFPEDWKSQAADKIEALKKAFFDEKDQVEKANKKFQIETEIQARMANSKQNFGYQVDFDFKLYFSEVWHEKGGFDVVIGNPPYGLLNKKQNQNYSIMVNTEHLDHYKNSPDYAAAQGGVINVYRLFVVKSGHMLNREGCFSMIFPLAYTGDVTSKKLRIETLQNKQILGIEAFPERDDENRRVFRHAKMSVCILFFRKKYDGSYDEFYIRSHADKYVDLNNSKTSLSISDIKTLDPINLTIPVLLASDLQVLKKIYLSTARISDFSNCYTGEIDLSLDKKYLETSDAYSVLLKGAIIDRYMIRIKMSQGEIAYLDSKKYLAENSGDRSRHFQHDRIGMQGITGVNERVRLKMALVPKGIFLANSVNYLFFPLEHEKLKFYLGQLNSELHNYVFKLSSTNSNVNGYEVNNLPIVRSNQFYLDFVYLVDYMLMVKKIVVGSDYRLMTSYLDELLNAMVYELYFPNEIKAANKEILKHLGDLKPITDDMSDEEKLAVIKKEFDRLYDPKHPVRNNLETLDSVEEVRIIREALKK